MTILCVGGDDNYHFANRKGKLKEKKRIRQLKLSIWAMVRI